MLDEDQKWHKVSLRFLGDDLDLTAVTSALRELLARPGVTAELFLGFSSGNGQGGFTLPASLLARIADLGLDVSLDLYPPSVDER